jgi:hypothetical protein
MPTVRIATMPIPGSTYKTNPATRIQTKTSEIRRKNGKYTRFKSWPGITETSAINSDGPLSKNLAYDILILKSHILSANAYCNSNENFVTTLNCHFMIQIFNIFTRIIKNAVNTIKSFDESPVKSTTVPSRLVSLKTPINGNIIAMLKVSKILATNIASSTKGKFTFSEPGMLM